MYRAIYRTTAAGKENEQEFQTEEEARNYLESGDVIPVRLMQQQKTLEVYSSPNPKLSFAELRQIFEEGPRADHPSRKGRMKSWN